MGARHSQTEVYFMSLLNLKCSYSYDATKLHIVKHTKLRTM